MFPSLSARFSPLMQTALSRLCDALDFLGRRLGGEMLLSGGSHNEWSAP